MEQNYEGLGDLHTIVNDLLQQLRASKGMGKGTFDFNIKSSLLSERGCVISVKLTNNFFNN